MGRDAGADLGILRGGGGGGYSGLNSEGLTQSGTDPSLESELAKLCHLGSIFGDSTTMKLPEPKVEISPPPPLGAVKLQFTLGHMKKSLGGCDSPV